MRGGIVGFVKCAVHVEEGLDDGLNEESDVMLDEELDELDDELDEELDELDDEPDEELDELAVDRSSFFT